MRYLLPRVLRESLRSADIAQIKDCLWEFLEITLKYGDSLKYSAGWEGIAVYHLFLCICSARTIKDSFVPQHDFPRFQINRVGPCCTDNSTRFLGFSCYKDGWSQTLKIHSYLYPWKSVGKCVSSTLPVWVTRVWFDSFLIFFLKFSTWHQISKECLSYRYLYFLNQTKCYLRW